MTDIFAKDLADIRALKAGLYLLLKETRFDNNITQERFETIVRFYDLSSKVENQLAEALERIEMYD